MPTPGSKERLAIHEAGHAAMYLLWCLPWRYASLTKKPDGTYKGAVIGRRHLFMDIPEFIKHCSIAVAGLTAESIFLERRIDWIPAKYSDFLKKEDFQIAQTEALKRMSEEHYLTVFAPQVMRLTHEALKDNWGTCVMIIAEELCMWDATTPEQLKPLINTLNYPLANTLNDIVRGY